MLRRRLAAVALLAALIGCSPTIKKPQLIGPGTAPTQRHNATQFDPYPLPDMGPEIVGGRPIDFLIPVPEVERANQFREQQFSRGQPVLVPQPAIPVQPTWPTSPPLAPTRPPIEYRY